MVFSSGLFLFLFLTVTLAGYYLAGRRGGNVWLLLASLFFFGYSHPKHLLVILAGIVINYVAALLISSIDNKSPAKAKDPKANVPRRNAVNWPRILILVAAVFLNLGILFYFKYFGFATQTAGRLLGKALSVPDVLMPIGISFFTFQGMSYVIDVFRRDVPAQKNPLHVALYIVLFPQLIAGPIVRYKEIAGEILNRQVSLADFTDGISRFLTGLAKKALVANTLAIAADAIWSNPVHENTPVIAWFGSIAYTLQIYYDFSGYSDMAIGLGRMFGFHFPENFDLPYVSKSISEFWRRWHISLGSWFRDYVYIPLGGNRRHVFFNLGLVFLLTGIWHGAAWHFILWGVWHGFFILAERLVKVIFSKKTTSSADNPKSGTITSNSKLTPWSVVKAVLSTCYAMAVVHIGWVLFRAPSLREAVTYLKAMFGLNKDLLHPGFTLGWYLDHYTLLILILAVLFAGPLPRLLGCFIKKKLSEPAVLILTRLALLILFVLSVISIVSGSYNPFIYFQF